MSEPEYIELNMTNYNANDVAQLNEWGIRAVSLIESTANMLRGMTLDPSIPNHAKNVMRDKIEELDSITEQ